MNQTLRFFHCVVLSAFAALCLTACNAQAHKAGTSATSPALQQKESALQGLRDSGVISEQEYQDRLAKLHGGSAAASPARATSTARGGGNSWKLKKVEFTSPIGYQAMPQYGIPEWPEKQVVAASILAPVDWDTKIGAANTPPDCSYTVGRIVVISTSPDKKYSFMLLPQPNSVWSNNRMLLQSIQAQNQQYAKSSNCPIEQPKPIAQRAAELLHKIAPPLQITGGVEPIPGLTDKLPAMLQQANASLAQQSQGMGRPSTLEAQAGKLHFMSSDPNDPSEGYLYIMQTLRTDYSPDGVVQTVETPLLFFTGAPQGKLQSSDLLFQAIMGSLNINPEYQAACLQVAANILHIHQVTTQRLNQISSEMAADNARTAAKISSIQAGVSQYRNQVMNNVAANRSAALEHSSQQFSMYMGDQAQYRDSSGRNVQLPSGAGHVWASSTGNTNEYILTDSASYNPNGNVGSAGWTEMRQVR